MKLRINFFKVRIENDTIQGFQEVISPIHMDDLLYLRVDVNGATVPLTNDPDNNSVTLVNIPTVNINDANTVEIGAICRTPNFRDFNSDFSDDFAIGLLSDFNDDFNNDFGVGGNPETISFHNIFQTYGYDLGNNGDTENPEFNIYFVSKNFPDFQTDFSFDFSYFYSTYSNFIAYRKPFTNEIHYYDNTSSPYDGSGGIKWWVEGFEDVLYENRNGIICTNDEINLNVMKELYGNVSTTISSSCGCGDEISSSRSLIQYWQTDMSVEENWKLFPNPLNTIVKSNCKNDKNDYEFNVLTENSAYSIIDYNIHQFYVNDELAYPYERDKLVHKVIDKSGYVRYSQTKEIFDMNDFLAQDCIFTFPIPIVGDYIVETNLISYNYDGEIVRTCEEIDKVTSCHWLTVNQESCGNYKMHNCSFDTVTVVIEKLVETNNGYVFEVVNTLEIPHLSTIDKSILVDGVYKITSTRESSDEEVIQVFVVDCNLKDCLKNVMDDLINNPPCKDFKHGFEQFNAIMALSLLYYGKLHNEYVNNYIYTALDNDKLEELYKIQTILDRLSLYCYDCEGFAITNCGC